VSGTETAQKIFYELIVMRFVKDLQISHKRQQSHNLTADKHIGDSRSHFFILDIQGGIGRSSAMQKHMIYCCLEVTGNSVLQILYGLLKTFILH
jgi:hypothetical protein